MLPCGFWINSKSQGQFLAPCSLLAKMKWRNEESFGTQFISNYPRSKDKIRPWFEGQRRRSSGRSGQSVSASQPSNTKTTTYFRKMSSELVCTFCGKQFSKETKLNQHIRDVHTEVEAPCNFCDKSFRSKKMLRYHISMTHDEKEALHCDIESEGIKCNFYSKDKSNLRAHKKGYMRNQPMWISHMFVACVATRQQRSLIWTNIVNLVENHQRPILLTTPAISVTKRFHQRSPWTGIQSYTTKITVIHQTKLFFVLCAEKRLRICGIWRGTNEKSMDSRKKEMSLRTVLELPYSQLKRLLRKQWLWLKEEKRRLVTNVISVITVLAKKIILGNTCKSMSRNQKGEEEKEKLAPFLKGPNAGERQRMPTTWQRGTFPFLERI